MLHNEEPLLLRRPKLLDILTLGTLYTQSVNKIILGQKFACKTMTANPSGSVLLLEARSPLLCIPYRMAYLRFSSNPALKLQVE